MSYHFALTRELLVDIQIMLHSRYDTMAKLLAGTNNKKDQEILKREMETTRQAYEQLVNAEVAWDDED